MQIALGREPGSEWDYSGGDYLVLQLIIEEVSGQTYEAYMHSALLQPLANDSGPLPSASNETMREPNADLFGLDFGRNEPPIHKAREWWQRHRGNLQWSAIAGHYVAGAE